MTSPLCTCEKPTVCEVEHPPESEFHAVTHCLECALQIPQEASVEGETWQMFRDYVNAGLFDNTATKRANEVEIERFIRENYVSREDVNEVLEALKNEWNKKGGSGLLNCIVELETLLKGK